jgi:hypothetical protein
MGGKRKNFEDPMLSAQDMTGKIIQSGHLYCSTLYVFKRLPLFHSAWRMLVHSLVHQSFSQHPSK